MKIGKCNNSGFTIVELLVVIVVIGILASITIVSYTGISNKAIISSMKSDLSGALRLLKIYQINDGGDNFPTAIDCSASPALNTICLKSSGSNIYNYSYNNSTNPKTFILDSINGSNRYRLTESLAPVAVTATSFTQGPFYATTVVDDSNVGTVVWSNPSSAAVSDNIYSDVVVVGTQTTHYLKATGFNFSIPTTATINGILVETEVYRASGGSENWSYTKLVKNGVIGTSNRLSATSSVNNVEKFVSIPTTGASTDLWGWTLSPADVNSSNFGVSAAFGPTGPSTTYVDSIRITVYYTDYL